MVNSWRIALPVRCVASPMADRVTTMHTLLGFVINDNFTWEPEFPMPLLHVHSIKDMSVPYYGVVQKNYMLSGLIPGSSQWCLEQRWFQTATNPFKTNAQSTSPQIVQIQICGHDGPAFGWHSWPSENNADFMANKGRCQNGISNQYILNFLQAAYTYCEIWCMHGGLRRLWLDYGLNTPIFIVISSASSTTNIYIYILMAWKRITMFLCQLWYSQ